MGSVCVVSVVHPVAILNAIFCVIYSLLMFVSDGSGDHIVEATNDPAFTRWSCHSGLAHPVQSVSTLPPATMGARLPCFGQAGHADPLDGWQCSS